MLDLCFDNQIIPKTAKFRNDVSLCGLSRKSFSTASPKRTIRTAVTIKGSDSGLMTSRSAMSWPVKSSVPKYSVLAVPSRVYSSMERPALFTIANSSPCLVKHWWVRS